MKEIRMIRNTTASGLALYAGETYRVGQDLSETDARDLLKLGKAVPADQKREPDAKGGKK